MDESNDLEKEVTRAMEKLDETIDLPITQEQACSLHLILSQSIQQTADLINRIKADLHLEMEKRTIKQENETLQEMLNLYTLILKDAKELLTDTNDVIKEFDSGPRVPEKPKIILSTQL